ncbi:hypothetical protein PoB_005133600 [Plakobranchus ocellatus]|uniref:Uncharacterized protein n=1 Tax=Plakobranchus ocellatus TaxID=259542 RepID=A0AAV4BWD1_9GAST|nr:hypothetical protein PoB_005133600 [Plakobranchus ocellatus]
MAIKFIHYTRRRYLHRARPKKQASGHLHSSAGDSPYRVSCDARSGLQTKVFDITDYCALCLLPSSNSTSDSFSLPLSPPKLPSPSSIST